MLTVIPISPAFGAPCRARLFLVQKLLVGTLAMIEGTHALVLWQMNSARDEFWILSRDFERFSDEFDAF